MFGSICRVSLLGLAAGMFAASGCSQSMQTTKMGEPLTINKSQTVQVATLLEHPEEYDGKTVRLAGQIDKVCENRGCWVTMAHNGKSLRIKFRCPMEGRFVPMEAQGHAAMVEGTFQIKRIDEDTARHFAEDSGASPEEVQKIKGPQPAFWMDSHGIEIEGMKKAAT